MIYVFKFNYALAAMNISVDLFTQEARLAAQAFGQQRGLTPQEAALVLVAEAFGLDYPLDACVPRAVESWRNARKIFETKPEVQAALIRLCLY